MSTNKNQINSIKIFKTILPILLTVIITIGATGCMKNLSSISVTDYLGDKYDDTFYIDETISPGIDVRYYEYHCHSSKYPDEKFVVYKENGKYKDNYYGILVSQQYQDSLNNILAKYFDNFKVYFRFINNFFDDEFTQVSELNKYINENPQNFFIDVFVYSCDEAAKNVDVESLNKELKNKFVNFYISLNYVDKEALKVMNENTYLSASCDNYYTNTVKSELY